jgi:hypothetical protein
MRLHFLVRLAQCIVLYTAISTTAFAQYGGGGTTTGAGTGGYTPPKGGYSAGTGIAIGAAVAAAVGVALLVRHRHHAAQPHASLVGCTQSAQSGFSVTNEKDHQTYLLVADNADLKAGERVELSGQKTKDGLGSRTFLVQNIVEDYGVCSPGSVSNVLAASR